MFSVSKNIFSTENFQKMFKYWMSWGLSQNARSAGGRAGQLRCGGGATAGQLADPRSCPGHTAAAAACTFPWQPTSLCTMTIKYNTILCTEQSTIDLQDSTYHCNFFTVPLKTRIFLLSYKFILIQSLSIHYRCTARPERDITLWNTNNKMYQASSPQYHSGPCRQRNHT